MEKLVENRKLDKLVKGSIGCILILLGIIVFSGQIIDRRVSPDKKQEVIVVGSYFPIPPRQFGIKIGKPSWFARYKTIYVSPDADDQEKERIIWSKDSTKFLIVSRNSVSNIPYGRNLITTGENIDLFYDLPSGKILADCYSTSVRVSELKKNSS